MKYILYEHAGSGNHGCEAIVRSTVKMLGDYNQFFLQTFAIEEDRFYQLNNVCNLVTVQPNIKRSSAKGLLLRTKTRINPSLDYDLIESIYKHRKLLKYGSVALSIGGDNYCYGGMVARMSERLNVFESKKIPTVLWGCSIDADALFELSVKDLKRYNMITARESLTVETLYDNGIRDTVVPCTDPAFTLERQAVNWNDDIFDQHSVIGINVSDFMGYYNAYPDATYRNFKTLIDYLLKNTEYYIALIPHVRQTGNDDLLPCKQLMSEFNSERVLTVEEDYNCMQLKDIIAKCKMFIGCRTHSTIAAYSTCVPTLVVGYSVKARGIAKDIFGDYTDLLVDVREFKSDKDLLNKYVKFCEREGELKTHLEKVMPDYINRAYLAKDALLRIKQ